MNERDWRSLEIIESRILNGIFVHQGCSTAKDAPLVGACIEDGGVLWYIFHVQKVDIGWFWYGQDPDGVELPEDPCDPDYLKDISS